MLTFKNELPEGNYQGWANYQTWNVALYIENDFGIYQLAKELRDYKQLANYLASERIYVTPDGIAWNDSALNLDELNEVIKEL